MKIVNDKKEFEEFYPYDKKYIKEYPKEYPCVVKCEFEERGIMGDEKVVYVAYYPSKNSSNDLFFEGLNYKWSILK
jgi:hypothetical protein